MTGVDVDAEKEKSSLDDSAMASKILNAPSPGVTRKGSMPRRRKSLLLTLNVENEHSSGDDSVSGSFHDLHQKAIRRKGSMINLYSHREPSTSPNSRNRVLLEPLTKPHRRRSASTSRSSKKKKNKSKRKETYDDLLGTNIQDDYSSGNESVFGSSLNLHQGGSARNSRRGIYTDMKKIPG